MMIYDGDFFGIEHGYIALAILAITGKQQIRIAYV